MSSATCSRLVLASTSPFRQALLRAAGVEFQVEAPGVDEGKITAAGGRALAQARALAKGLDVSRRAASALVIGADQVLATEDGRTFDKAASESEAEQRLEGLAGKTHYLHSAFVLVFWSGAGEPIVLVDRVVDAPMQMRALSGAEIKAYVATGEWRGAVGCYQFENRGSHLFQGAAPDQSTVIGLPMLPLLGELRRLGVHHLTAPRGPWTLAL